MPRTSRKVNECITLPMSHTFVAQVLPEGCPICGGDVELQDIEAWSQVGNTNEWEATEIVTQCEHEPPIDSEEWEEWHKGHYSMPYVDWLPYQQRMLQWVNDNYRFVDDKEVQRAK